jgi:TRAP-type mannitol/chloroaromatic compound transport system permease small subunit
VTGARPSWLAAAERIAKSLDRFTCTMGRAVSWLCLAMVVMTGVVVALRYLFDFGWIWLQETVIWMHATVFLLAAGYTLSLDEHVRVDVIYRGMSPRRQLVVDTLGVALLLLPTCGWMVWSAWDYMLASWHVYESSQETGGLHGLYLLKTLIVATPLLIAIEAVAIIVLGWARVLTLSGDAD